MNDIESNKKVARRYLELVAQGDAKGTAALFTEDGAIVVPSSTNLPDETRGRAAVEQLVAQVLTVFPKTGLHVKIDQMTCEDNRVAAVAHAEGAISADGKRYDNRYHFLFYFEDGKIKEVHEYMDSLLLQNIFFPGA
jgi:uncharacterized protein (TIGR02246 family)